MRKHSQEGREAQGLCRTAPVEGLEAASGHAHHVRQDTSRRPLQVEHLDGVFPRSEPLQTPAPQAMPHLKS